VKQICNNNDILSDPLHIAHAFKHYFSSSDPLHIAHAFKHYFSSLCSSKSVCSDGLAWWSYSSMPAGPFSFKKIMPTDVFNVLQDLKLNFQIIWSCTAL